MLAKLRTKACGYGRKNTRREVYQQSFIQNICEGMIKPGTRVHAEEEWQAVKTEWALGQWWEKWAGIQRSVASETKLCSLTATNSAGGCQLSIRKQMRTFVTDHYLTVSSQCKDIKERQYLHKRTEVLRSVRNRIKNWCDTSSTDSKRMCSVGYSSMGPLTGNYNTRDY